MISFPSFLLFLLSSFVSCLPAIPLAPLSLGTDKAIPGGYIITLGPRSLSSSQFTSAVHGDAFNAQWNEKENDHYSWLENILSTKADFTLSSSSAPVKAKVQHKYKVGNYRGYSAVLSDDLIELIRQRPEVRSVEADEVVSIKKVLLYQRKLNLIKSKEFLKLFKGLLLGIWFVFLKIELLIIRSHQFMYIQKKLD